MAYFPFCADIKNRHCLIAGGGPVALRKVEQLMPFEPEITVISPDIHPDIEKLADRVIRRKFEDPDIAEDTDFVVAASDDKGVNHHIAALCRDKKIPVNVVDDPEYCTFFFPALLKRGKLTIGVSTSGACPAAASWLRDRTGEVVPENFDKILDTMEEERKTAKNTIPDGKKRKEYLTEKFCCLLAGEDSERENQKKNRDKSDQEIKGDNFPDAQVTLAGAGCGTLDWLTIEGARAVKRCEALVYDDLIDDSILDLVPKNAEKIYVGKRGGRTSASQEEINALLIDLARQGKRVVRLKGGDPFVFGRGGEEILALKEAGVTWKVVPGISSALAIPEEYGIPVTHRDLSRSVHVITAHTSDDKLRKDIEQFAHLEGTLVILMGMTDLKTIVKALIECGCSDKTPVALLSGGNSLHPYKIIGRLENIVEKAEDEHPEPPGVIVVGSVVNLDLMSRKKKSHKCLIGLTGTDEFQDRLKAGLIPLGYRTVSLMTGMSILSEMEIPFDEITDKRKKWLVFTGAKSVSYFFAECRKRRIDLRGFASCRFAVIGKATGEALGSEGFTADLCPAEYNSMALEQELKRQKASDEDVYLFCSAQGRGFTDLVCHRYDIYETKYVCGGQNKGTPDIIVFGSAGAVRAMKKSGADIPEQTDILCIGPVCREAVSDCFDREAAMADEASVEKLMEAVETMTNERPL